MKKKITWIHNENYCQFTLQNFPSFCTAKEGWRNRRDWRKRVARGTKDLGDSGRKFSLSWVRLASRKSIGDISACTACTQYKRIPKSQPVAEPTHIYVCMAFSLFHNYYYACGCVWVCVLVCVGVCALRLSCPNAPFNVISYGFVLTSALCSPASPSAISPPPSLSLSLSIPVWVVAFQCIRNGRISCAAGRAEREGGVGLRYTSGRVPPAPS